MEGRRANGIAIYVPEVRYSSKAAIDLCRQDTLVRGGRHYRVLEVIEYGYEDFDPGCSEVELVTEPRLPIGEESFSPSTLVTIIDQ
jgi:hypothetical protein